MQKFNTVEELQEYLDGGVYDTKTLMNALSSMIIIEKTWCFMQLWRGNKGWTICYNSNDKKVGTPNITSKDYDLDSVCVKALRYLLEWNFHHLQNKDRNIFVDMLTVKS